MNTRCMIRFSIFSVIIWFMAAAPIAHALTPIARITGFGGDVVLLSGQTFKEVKVGRIIYHDDWIQTEKGEVEIEFNDGALLKIREYSSIVIRERMERLDKRSRAKSLVRRITCFVGSIIFKRGKNKENNYLQAPMFLAGVRGTRLGVESPKKVTIDWEAGPAGEIFGDIKVGLVPAPNEENWTASACVQAFLKAYKVPIRRNIIDAKKVAYETMIGNSYISSDERNDLTRLLRKLQTTKSMPPHVNIRNLDLDRTRIRIDRDHEHIRIIKEDIRALTENLGAEYISHADENEIQHELNNQYIMLNALEEEIHLLESHEIELIGTSSCFAGETLVQAGDGNLKRIEDVRSGDTIIAYDIGEDRRVVRKVIETYEGQVEFYFLLNNELRVARGERFLTSEGWKRVESLRKGDRLCNGSSEEPIRSIERVHGTLRVHNLGVEDSHTFFVIPGKGQAFVVHNSAGGGGK